VPVSLPRQFFKASCTLLEYGTEGGGSLNAGGGGGTGQITLGGGEVVAQPVALSASASSSSPGKLFALLGIVDRSYDIDGLTALCRPGLLCALALQFQPGHFLLRIDPGVPLHPSAEPGHQAGQQQDQLCGDAHGEPSKSAARSYISPQVSGCGLPGRQLRK